MESSNRSTAASSPHQSGERAQMEPTFHLVVEEQQLIHLNRLARDFVGAALKVAWQVLRGNPDFPSLEGLGLTGEQARLLRQKIPDRPATITLIARLDTTTDGAQVVTYELNGDQPGGLILTGEVIGEDGSAAGGEATVGGPYGLYLAGVSAWFTRETGREAPAGVLYLANRYHLVEPVRARLVNHFGAVVHIADDASRCELRGDRLVYVDDAGRGHAVDLVLRSPRVNIYELVSTPFQPVVQAWLRGHVVLLNPPSSRVLGCKSLYPLLANQDLLAAAAVTDEEARAVGSILPPVFFVTQVPRERLLDRVRWVLKAPLGGSGRRVWLGPECDDTQWAGLLEEAAREAGWICQAWRPPFRLPVHPVQGGPPVLAPASIDPYVITCPELRVAGHLCRAVLPISGDDNELENVKLNLLGNQTYRGADGRTHRRVVELGRIRLAGA